MRAVVRLHDSVRHLRRRHDGEREHDAIRVLFANFGDQQRAHSSTGATTKGMSNLKALEAVAALGLLTHDVKHGIDELSPLGVVALRPVVPRPGLTEDEVVRAEELAERS